MDLNDHLIWSDRSAKPLAPPIGSLEKHAAIAGGLTFSVRNRALSPPIFCLFGRSPHDNATGSLGIEVFEITLLFLELRLPVDPG